MPDRERVFYNVYLAMEAYQAYCESVSWVSFRGEPLPTWNKLQDRIKHAWDEAAYSVRVRVEGNGMSDRVERHDAGGTAPSGDDVTTILEDLGDVNRDFVAEIRNNSGILLARYFLYNSPLPLLSTSEQSRTYYLYDSHGTSQHVPTGTMVITRVHGAEIEEPERNEA